MGAWDGCVRPAPRDPGVFQGAGGASTAAAPVSREPMPETQGAGGKGTAAAPVSREPMPETQGAGGKGGSTGDGGAGGGKSAGGKGWTGKDVPARQNWKQAGSDLMSEILGVMLRKHGWPDDEEDEDASARRWQRKTQDAFDDAGIKITVIYKPWGKLEERVRDVVKALNKEHGGAKTGDRRSWQDDFLAAELLRPGSHTGGLKRHAVVMGETAAGGAKRAFKGPLEGYWEGVGDGPASDAPDVDDAEAYKRDAARADMGAAPPSFLRGVADPEGPSGGDCPSLPPSAEKCPYKVPPEPQPLDLKHYF